MMNAEATPKMKLTRLEKKYWLILVEKSTAEWSDIDALMASQMCRDLALVEELTRADAENNLIADMCRRIFEGANLLNLDRATATRNPNTQRKIVETIFKGI